MKLTSNRTYLNVVFKPLAQQAWNSPSVWVFLALVSLYLLTMGGQLFISDGVAMYYTTRAIVRDHTLAVEPNVALPQLVVGWDRRTYSVVDWGQPFIGIPFYVAGWVLAAVLPRGDEVALTVFSISLLPQVVTALAGLILYRIGISIFRNENIAIGIALLWGTGTLAWAYSKVYFAEALLTLLLLLSCWLLLEGRRRRSKLALLLAGVVLGGAMSVRVAAIIYLAAFVAFILVDALEASEMKTAIPRMLKRAAIFSAGIVPAIWLLLWHNYIRFQDIWITGYQGQEFTTPLYIGLYGLLLSPGRSLLLFSPLVALGLLSLPGFLRRFAPMSAFIVTGFAIALLFYGQWWAWHGGWSWGPRFMVPLVPFMLIPIGTLLSSRRLLIIVVIVWIISLLVIIPGISVDFNAYFVDLLYHEHISENSLWFDPWHSQILVQWQYLLQGRAISFGGNHLSDFGLPRIANYLYFPIMGLVFLVSSTHLAEICLHRQPETKEGSNLST